MSAVRRRSDLPEISESVAATNYTSQWHAVYDWAVATCDRIPGFEWGMIPEPAARMHRMRAIIKRQYDDEGAYKKAVPIIDLYDWLSLPAPGQKQGGRRRVVIRVFCWVMDRHNKNAYDPEWVRLADDMSAYASRARALRWASAYDKLLQAGRESREIRMTALEIAWWTREKSVKHV